MKSQDETLEDWCRALLQALELEDVEVDVNEVLALAGVGSALHSAPGGPFDDIHRRLCGRPGLGLRTGH